MKKRSLAGLLALFMVIAFLAVSCDSPVGGKSGNGGGGGGTPKPNATIEDLKALKDTLEDDDWVAIERALGPPLPELDDNGELILENGMTFDGDVETGGIITYTNYKVERYNTGKELTLNGIFKFEIARGYSLKLTVSGSTNGPVKSDVVVDFDEDNGMSANGVITINGKNFDVNDIIAVRDDTYDFGQDKKDDGNDGNTEDNGNNGNTGNNGNNSSGSFGDLTAQQLEEFFAFSELFFDLVEEIPTMFASGELPNGIEYDLYTNSTTFDNYTLENGATISGTITNEVEMDSNFQPISICQKTDLTLTGMSINTLKADFYSTGEGDYEGTFIIDGIEYSAADIIENLPELDWSSDDDDDYPGDGTSTGENAAFIALMDTLTYDDYKALYFSINPYDVRYYTSDCDGYDEESSYDDVNGYSVYTHTFEDCTVDYNGTELTINGTFIEKYSTPYEDIVKLTVSGAPSGLIELDFIHYYDYGEIDQYDGTISINGESFQMSKEIADIIYYYW